MKKMKPQSTQPCSWCKARANWRSTQLSMVKYACNTHKSTLQNHEQQSRDDGYMSEADHQTWGRL